MHLYHSLNPVGNSGFTFGKSVKRLTWAACGGESSLLAFSHRFIYEVQQRNICSGLRFNTICMYLSNKYSVQDSWEVNIVVFHRFTVTNS